MTAIPLSIRITFLAGSILLLLAARARPEISVPDGAPSPPDAPFVVAELPTDIPEESESPSRARVAPDASLRLTTLEPKSESREEESSPVVTTPIPNNEDAEQQESSDPSSGQPEPETLDEKDADTRKTPPTPPAEEEADVPPDSMIAANPCNPEAHKDVLPNSEWRDAESTSIGAIGNVEELVAEFLVTAHDISDRPGGREAGYFPGPAEKPSWFQALRITRDDNPLLEDQCRKEALGLSVDSLRSRMQITDEQEALNAAAVHMQKHRDFIKENEISYAGYLTEIANCDSFCAPLVTHLISCHALSVARRTHGIVLFDLDSADLGPRTDLDIVGAVAEQLAEDPTQRVVLIGRASRLGDLSYNRRLAGRRALAVKDALELEGVRSDRIQTMWFGWEPPQISLWIAKSTGWRISTAS